ncbi:exodeoxyribonuclease III [Brevundimonas sp.]|uniref:exodeoxyribonuclease III n=1 Tax=Brevundimonas sp. TaxID=1871086 RepID=UPI0035642789
MRIATFNINGINSRLERLTDWLTETGPDIVCLQELKTPQRTFPDAALAALGYQSVWLGEARWNGVAILSRIGEPIVTRRSLPGAGQDQQSRYIEAAVAGILVGCLYLPNGNPRPGPKFDYKMRWSDRLVAHAGSLVEAGVPAVLCGDYNIVPTDRDIYNPASWRENALLQPEPRQSFADLLGQGWSDALAERYPHDPQWTFWSYLRKAWDRDSGWRIDHLLLSPAVAHRLVDAGVDRHVRDPAGASDHAPVWIDLTD